MPANGMQANADPPHASAHGLAMEVRRLSAQVAQVERCISDGLRNGKDVPTAVPAAVWTRSLRSLHSESEHSIQRDESMMLSIEMDEARWEVVYGMVDEERKARIQNFESLPSAAASAMAWDPTTSVPSSVPSRSDLSSESRSLLEDCDGAACRAFRLIATQLRSEFHQEMESLARELRLRMDTFESRMTIGESAARRPAGAAEKQEQDKYPQEHRWQWHQLQQEAQQLPDGQLEGEVRPHRPHAPKVQGLQDLPSDVDSEVTIKATNSNCLLWGVSGQSAAIDAFSLASADVNPVSTAPTAPPAPAPEPGPSPAPAPATSAAPAASLSLARRARTAATREEPASEARRAASLSVGRPGQRTTSSSPQRRASSVAPYGSNEQPDAKPGSHQVPQVTRMTLPARLGAPVTPRKKSATSQQSAPHRAQEPPPWPQQPSSQLSTPRREPPQSAQQAQLQRQQFQYGVAPLQQTQQPQTTLQQSQQPQARLQQTQQPHQAPQFNGNYLLQAMATLKQNQHVQSAVTPTLQQLRAASRNREQNR
mmetsp:Transcript_5685/g.10172  ORF Transcript_5685/g.10172 Transcript_5685/m.10172 type:complete len:539 (-) Transcript_5685:108-1724(-)